MNNRDYLKFTKCLPMAAILLDHKSGLRAIDDSINASEIPKRIIRGLKIEERLAVHAILLSNFWSNFPKGELSVQIGSNIITSTDTWPESIQPKPINALKQGISIAKGGGTSQVKAIIKSRSYLAYEYAGADFTTGSDSSLDDDLVDEIITRWPYPSVNAILPNQSKGRYLGLLHSATKAVAQYIYETYKEAI
jgi:hypothetical protein